MAEIVKTVRIETGSGEKSVKSLKAEIAALRDALLNMEKGGEDWVRTAEQLTQAQEELNSVMKAGKQVVDENGTSIVSMEARYKSLYNTYKLLSQEARKSAEGMSMQKELAELSKNLNSVKKDAGNFKDNIGHYADDMMSAFGQLGISVGALQGPFKLASTGASGFKKILDLLAKHPFLVAATILIGLFKKIGDAIKNNEELQQRMNKVMAAFKPIGDAMAIVLDKVAGLAVRVAEGIAKVVTWFTNLLGITRELNEEELKLAETENELDKKRREYAEENAKDTNRIEQLREEASETDNVTEQLEKLTEAKKLQAKVNERNVELAKKELEYLEEQAKLRPNSKEDNDRISQAKINLENVEASGAKAIRTLNKGIESVRKAASKAGDDEKKQLDEILKRVEDNTKTEKQLLKEKYEEEKALLIKYHKDTTKLDEEYQRNLRKIELNSIKERTTAQLGYYSTIYNLAVMPSTEGFKAKHSLLEAERNQFIDDVNKIFGSGVTVNKDGVLQIPIELLYKEDTKELTEGAKTLSEAFGIGLANGLEKDQVIQVIKKFLADKDIQDELATNERINWEREIREAEAEMELLKKSLPGPMGQTLDQITERLGEQVKAETDYYAKRLAEAEVFFNSLKDKEEDELNALGYTLNDKLDAERDYYNALADLQEKQLENERILREGEKEIEEERIASLHELKMVTFDAVYSMADTYKVLLDAYVKDGEVSEREAKKKANTLKWLERIQGAAAVASIIADTATGWMELNKSQAAEYALNAQTAAATGPGAAAAKAALDAKTTLVHTLRKATLIVNGVAAAGAAIGKTIASIKSLAGDSDVDGGSGAGASAAPQLIDSAPYSYTRELQTDVEREEVLNRPIYVRVTDIDEAQEKVSQRNAEVTF